MINDRNIIKVLINGCSLYRETIILKEYIDYQRKE